MKFVVLFLLLGCGNCANAQSLLTHADVDTLRMWMTGTFTSQEQSKLDSSYLDIRMQVAHMWQHRIDGAWLYVEQAKANNIDRPFSQQVYHLFMINDTTIVNQVYELKTPTRAVGAWRSTKPLDDLRIDSLEQQESCAIIIQKSFDNFYHGSVADKQCRSNLGGAAYVTLERKIFPERIVSRERGWGMYNEQVWGPVKTGYTFIKEK